jgi:hypothetical protein
VDKRAFPGAAFAFLLNWKKGRSPVDVPNAPWTLRLFGVRTRLEQIRSLSRQSFALGDSLGQPNQVETVVNLSPAITPGQLLQNPRPGSTSAKTLIVLIFSLMGSHDDQNLYVPSPLQNVYAHVMLVADQSQIYVSARNLQVENPSLIEEGRKPRANQRNLGGNPVNR